MEINKTLEERGKTYGKFEDNAFFAQQFKNLYRNSLNWDKLNSAQKEALDMCASKFSRILTGDINHVDNWHDPQGYLKLAEESLKDE